MATAKKTEETTTANTEIAAPANDQALKNRLRSEAEREVLNAHKDEFHELATRKFAENGLTFTRRLTEAEKAEKKMNDLLAQHPELAGKFGNQPVVNTAEADYPEEPVYEG